MRKTISTLLALVLCLSLCACGNKNTDIPTENVSNNSEADSALLGQWVSVEDRKLFFMFTDDKEGTASNREREAPIKWLYDAEANNYVITILDEDTFSIQLDMIEGFDCFTYDAHTYIRIDEYDAFMENSESADTEETTITTESSDVEETLSEENEARNEIYGYVADRTQIEFGVEYVYSEGIVIKFVDVSFDTVNGDDCVCLNVEITFDSNTESTLIREVVDIEHKTHYLCDGTKLSWSGGHIQWGMNIDSGAGAKDTEPGATVSTRGSIHTDASRHYNNINKGRLDSISVMLCTFEMNGTEYYIDLSDYFTE